MGSVGIIVILAGLFFCFTFCQTTGAPSSFPPSRIVNTTYGSIQGRRLIYKGHKKVDAFQGIPYAKPPVGDLRFKRPVPPDTWTGVKETKNYGPKPIQKDVIVAIDRAVPQSEDCLTLNVFTPVWKPQNNGFPVIVFIHGGAFTQGSAAAYNDINISKYLVKKGVVLVTIQYRLGFLGFWSTGDENCPGNNALWDSTLALEWVNQNIARFNGDPGNISLMGLSSGGVMADMLSISPHSRDLFHKVITMCGTAAVNWATEPRCQAICKDKGKQLGVPFNNDTVKWLDDLRMLPAEDFGAFLSIVDGDDLPGPVFDGLFFPKPIPELIREAPSKPRMIGMTHYEGLLFMIGQDTLSLVNDTAARLFPEDEFPSNFQTLQKEYSSRLYNSSSPDFNAKKTIAETIGDWLTVLGAQLSVMEYTRNSSSNVNFYRFDYFTPKMYGIFSDYLPFVDSTHGADIVFFLASPIFAPFNFTKTDLKMIDEMTTRLSNFAKHGDPNGRDLVKWEPVKDNVQKHLRIGATSKMSDEFFEGRPFWCLNTRIQANLTPYLEKA